VNRVRGKGLLGSVAVGGLNIWNFFTSCSRDDGDRAKFSNSVLFIEGTVTTDKMQPSSFNPRNVIVQYLIPVFRVSAPDQNSVRISWLHRASSVQEAEPIPPPARACEWGHCVCRRTGWDDGALYGQVAAPAVQGSTPQEAME
jgi:hypothetical protein